MVERVRDKEAQVRMQAVLALSKFQSVDHYSILRISLIIKMIVYPLPCHYSFPIVQHIYLLVGRRRCFHRGQRGTSSYQHHAQ